MKKLFALVLAATLTVCMIVFASAASVGSPVAETASVPEVVMDEENTGIIIELIPTEEAEKQTEEKQAAFAAAQDALEEAAPEDMATISFFYLRAFSVDESGEMTEITEPIEVTLKIDEITDIEAITEVTVMQFVEGEWGELETVMNPDGTITIKDVVEGPVAIFAK